MNLDRMRKHNRLGNPSRQVAPQPPRPEPDVIEIRDAAGRVIRTIERKPR